MRHKARWGLLSHRTSVAFVVLLLCPAILSIFTQDSDVSMPHQEVEHWAKKIGNHIFHLSNTFAYYEDIKRNFEEKAELKENDGLQLVKEMAEDVTNMMQFKVEAVKRIMNVAEEASLGERSDDEGDDVDYYNAKRLNDYYPKDHKHEFQLLEGYRELELVPNSHFDGIPVNENTSSVHVPTNVFDKAPDVIKAIRWSSRLDRTFKSNYELDPTLSWQYFGSASGFLRQYPATRWVLDEKDPDLYDARLRSWYIEAANSPKDVVILLDTSGSMTGLRREIAKHVVLNILETLNENDFVNVFNFSEETTELVPCFTDTLVQANLENIGEFKKALTDGETKNIANFTESLTTAFELLQRSNSKYNKSGQGSQCNQAIMLVTDGAPDNFRAIFEKYNWPQIQVRMFTYLIGREETKIRDLKWMACANKGYFVHVTTLAEVREQVLKYIPVMARPMVMYQKEHPQVWTGVYADIADPKQTDWLWELRERKRQMDRTNNYRKLKKIVQDKSYSLRLPSILKDYREIEKFLEYGEFELSSREIARLKAKQAKTTRGRRDAPGSREGYRLMTSVSVPVFDRNKTTVRSANLLGVAGTDVPVREIEKLVPPYKLGVNGYSFMVNHNGYILYHPDLRPVFQDILKPNYNSVDFAEVELIDDDEGPRANDSELLQLRRDLIDHLENEYNLRVKIHLDDMKRVVTRKQWYFTQEVKGTPFSLGIALPEGYGKYKVEGQIELTREFQDPRSKKAATDYFSGNKWSLHPEWVYCEYKYDQNNPNTTLEELMLDFLHRAQEPRWKWRSTRTRAPPDSNMKHPQYSNRKPGVLENERRDNYYCDKELVQSMLFDARATDVYNKNTDDKISSKYHSGQQNFGLMTSFVATRSGFTRWNDLTKQPKPEHDLGFEEPHIMQVHNKAIDEVWYKRAVDYFQEDPNAFVYSVPFDAAAQRPEDVLVTASRAIFITENNSRKAPAAVVGVTINHQKFVEFFKNETYKCPSYPSRENSCQDSKTCESKSLDCYLLDDNGFIIASENDDDTGRFFGTLEGTIMESLVQSEVYKRVRIYDYQAVCLDSEHEPSPASILMTPIQMFKWTANWLMGNLFWVMVKTQLYTLWDPNNAWAFTHTTREAQYPNINEPPINGFEPHPNPNDYMDNRDPNFDESSLMPDDGYEYDEMVEGDGDFPRLELAYINKTRPRPCDKEVHLYKLQNHKLKQGGKFKPVKGKLSNCHTNGCGRPFSVQKVINTNLILVAVNNLCPCESRKVDIEPVEVNTNYTQRCERLLLNHYRKRPGSCISYHPDEEDIEECGGAGCMSVPSMATLALLVLVHACNVFKFQS